MTSLWLAWAGLVAGLLFVSSCGGGGTPATGGGEAPAVGTFTKTVSLPAVGQGDWIGLFRSASGSRRYQALVQAEDVQGSGPVASLTFSFGATSAGNSCPDVTIKMGHTSVTTLGTTFAANVEQGRGSLVTVYGPATLTIPRGLAGGFFTIRLNGAFNYNGVDNLVVDITAEACTANTDLAAHAASVPYTALIWNVTDSTAVTGTTWNALADLTLAFAGGGDTVAYAGTSGNSYPFGTVPHKVQMLYSAVEVNGSGPITGLAFPVKWATVATQTYTATVRLGHTTLTGLGTDFAANFDVGAPVTVANGLTFEIPAGVPDGGFVWIPMPVGVFTYNGRDDLVVEIDVSATSGTTLWRTDNSGTNTRLFATSGSPIGNLDNVRYDLRFRFAGATMDVNTPEGMGGGSTETFPFVSAEGKRQWLYRAVDLGTKGTIAAIACRTGNDQTAGGTFAYQLAMSHTSSDVLGTDFAANLPAPVSVLDGGYILHLGHKAGDWVEFPLTTPFAYNGRDNLVVQMAGTGPAGTGLECVVDGRSSVLYANRRAWAPTATAVTGDVTSHLADMRFTLH